MSGIKAKIKIIARNRYISPIYNFFVGKKRDARYNRYAQLPIDERMIVFESFKGKKFTDSPRAIYEYLLDHKEYKDYHFVWCFRDSVKEQFISVANDPRTKLVSWGSEEYYKTYAQAKYWITNTKIPLAIGKRDEQVYVQCWHGTPLKRLGCDIDTEATESKKETRDAIHKDVIRYDYLISPSAFFTEVMTSAFDLKTIGKESILLESGYPRNDALINYTQADVKRIKETLGIPDNKKVILYAPTYRENLRGSDKKYKYSEPLNFDQLRKDLGTEYVILFRAHYFIAQSFNFDEYEGFVINASDYPEINDLYIVSDMLITDYSSVFFDYSNLNRPIAFYMYDLEFYRDELRGFYLNTEELPGPIVEKQEDLVETIRTVDEWSCNIKYKEKYKIFTDRFSSLDDGHATERVVKTVLREE